MKSKNFFKDAVNPKQFGKKSCHSAKHEGGKIKALHRPGPPREKGLTRLSFFTILWQLTLR